MVFMLFSKIPITRKGKEHHKRKKGKPIICGARLTMKVIKYVEDLNNYVLLVTEYPKLLGLFYYY